MAQLGTGGTPEFNVGDIVSVEGYNGFWPVEAVKADFVYIGLPGGLMAPLEHVTLICRAENRER